MDPLPFTYTQLLLLMGGTLTLFALWFFLYRQKLAPPSRLETSLRQAPGDIPAEVITLALYEDSYPAFVQIVGEVLRHFPLQRFLRKPEFGQALHLLQQAPESPQVQSSVPEAMCQVVRCFVEDPDVEYRLRPLLHELVEEFLRELEAGEAGD